ncbi:unnamed protein product [Tetraodon nigroviridis]|uniref:(spotted green pufferfish) hypothetical protein n=1 Tax=Tetraodon nigroviridis TaxID=99883 RepID=Q4S8F9_TETNG|nr:unnamed protein product [Tetraodon nigroviridis]
MTWVPVLLDFQSRQGIWGFIPGKLSQPLALHFGDYNLDGFPDALAVLRNTSGSKSRDIDQFQSRIRCRGQQAFLLENVPCNAASCHAAGRMFHIHWDQSDLGAVHNAAMATFFDIYEDGILDMLVLSQADGKKDLIVHALKNNFEADAYFVKVMGLTLGPRWGGFAWQWVVLLHVEPLLEKMPDSLKSVSFSVLSGLCSNDCPEDVMPFGVNQPGPYVMYTTVDSSGDLKNASDFIHLMAKLIRASFFWPDWEVYVRTNLSIVWSTSNLPRGQKAAKTPNPGQLSQSAHFSLQLPYTVLGLGRSANFLDHLYVGIPRQTGETEIRKQEWTAIIPNSQLIVIPYPHDKPRSWSAKLYLTPSNSVLLTAIALIGVCVFILVIIGILHWQEKKADDREKRQEAHRFHFDAM